MLEFLFALPSYGFHVCTSVYRGVQNSADLYGPFRRQWMKREVTKLKILTDLNVLRNDLEKYNLSF
jgi:hypothetical protein